MLKLHFTFLLPLVLFIISCEPTPIGNQKAIAEEIENREIKRVTKVQILEETLQKGKAITQQLNAELQDSLRLLATIDTLSRNVKGTIRLVTLNGNFTDSLEKETYEAYAYAVANNLPVDPNVQDLENGSILYTTPILNQVIQPDSVGFYGLWSIRFSKKEIIKKMK